MGRRSHVAHIKNLFSRKAPSEAKRVDAVQKLAAKNVSGENLNNVHCIEVRRQNSDGDYCERFQDVISPDDGIRSFASKLDAKERKKSTARVQYATLDSCVTYNEEVFPLQAVTSSSKKHNLEKVPVFEQTLFVENFEQKVEAREKNARESLYARQAFEREKKELLRQLETQQQIMDEIVLSMKKNHEEELRKIEQKLNLSIQKHCYILTSLQAKLKDFLKKFENLPTCDAKCQRDHVLCEMKKACDEHFISKDLDTIHSSSCCLDTSSGSVPGDRGNVVTEDQGDRISLVRNSGTRAVYEPKQSSNTVEESEIQQEINIAYRKQKNELLQLFADEKQAFEYRIEKAKAEFEIKTRSEYETRTLIERRAWQETIRDYEREISILKFEREQMDRSYCIEMDKLKTEFEKEKINIHQRHVQQQALLCRKLSEKLRLDSVKAFNESRHVSNIPHL